MQLEVNAEIAKTIKKKWELLVFKTVEFIRIVLDAYLWGLFKFLIPV